MPASTSPGTVHTAISRVAVASRQVRRLRAARGRAAVRSAMVVSLLLGVGASGCALAPADQEAIRRAWSERDGERARECRQARGGFVAGACVFGGGS